MKGANVSNGITLYEILFCSGIVQKNALFFLDQFTNCIKRIMGRPGVIKLATFAILIGGHHSLDTVSDFVFAFSSFIATIILVCVFFLVLFYFLACVFKHLGMNSI